MHKWLVNGRKIRLCNACMRALTPVVMLGSWKWLTEERDTGIPCDRCRCTDGIADRYGCFRRLIRRLSLFGRARRHPRIADNAKAA